MSQEDLGTVVSYEVEDGELGKIRAWAGHYRGSGITRLGLEKPQRFTSEQCKRIIDSLTKIALQCPRARDHLHKPSGDGIDLSVGLAVGYVEVRTPFATVFAEDFGKALKRAGLNPKDCRIEALRPNWIRLGNLVQRGVDESK